MPLAPRPVRSLSLLGFLCVAPLRAQEPEAPAADRALPSIVLVTVDTLRRDHLSCYGYVRETSPHVDALAKEGIVFDRALATMASTYPSHLSMLTGVYPHQHGRTSNRDGLQNPFTGGAGGVASIAEPLREAGYATAAFVSSQVLDARTGIGAGFEHFEGPRGSDRDLNAGEVTALALRWLASQDDGRPFLLWVHYWDTHEPNAPPAEWRARFDGGDELAAWIAARGIDPARLEERFSRDAQVQRHFLGVQESRREIQQGPPRRRNRKREQAAPVPIDRATLLDLYDRYDADLAHIDHQLGRLLDALRADARWPRTAVLFTADHGQALGENDRLGHGRITDVNVFVPLILRLPEAAGVAPRRDSRVVSIVDLAPTVLGLLPPELLPELRAQVGGIDLAAPEPERGRVLVQQSTLFQQGDARHFAFYDGRWKLVQVEGGPAVLHDLSAAGEAVDVAGDHPDVVARLEAALGEELARGSAVQAEGADDADLEDLYENLRDLGYVGD